jgi:predicted XRE-type DNA-binding protein
MSKRRTAKSSFWAQGPVVATQRQTKLKLAYAINRAIKSQKLVRTSAAGMLDLAPLKVAHLRSYNLRGFSVEELAGFLTALNRNTEVSQGRRD